MYELEICGWKNMQHPLHLGGQRKRRTHYYLKKAGHMGRGVKSPGLFVLLNIPESFLELGES